MDEIDLNLVEHGVEASLEYIHALDILVKGTSLYALVAPFRRHVGKPENEIVSMCSSAISKN